MAKKRWTLKDNNHWHAINGEVGCIPDNNVVCKTKREAAEYLAELFEETRGVLTDLLRYEYCDRALVGASYCEIIFCDEPDCLETEDW